MLNDKIKIEKKTIIVNSIMWGGTLKPPLVLLLIIKKYVSY
jgi:hypothetical protein